MFGTEKKNYYFCEKTFLEHAYNNEIRIEKSRKN